MRVVFFGTPEPAERALASLLESRHAVVGVVTQPDRPRGRSGAPQPSPVKLRATEAGLDVLQPHTPRDPGFAEALAALGPDAGAIVAYGHLLPPEVLAVPPRGIVNVHFSLLPLYRGAAPVQRAIMAGETNTGVTTFALEPTFDTGPMLRQVREPILPEDTTGTLLERLAAIGARALVETLDGMEDGSLEPIPQDDGAASPAPKIRPEEGEIDWTKPSSEIVNRIRALDPAPGAYGTFRDKRIKIWRGRAIRDVSGAPGEVVGAGKDRLVVATGDAAVELLEVQLEGAKRMAAADFVRGHRPTEGETFRSR